MIESYRESCKKAASAIPGWEKLNKNELCRLCIDNEDNDALHNAYFAAVLYNYCTTVSKYYQSCRGLVDEATCIEWLEDAVQYALLHRRWEDPNSSIYNDPNGPDKVINRIMKCTKVNLYQYVSRKKRKDSYNVKSLDAITELVNDGTLELMDKDDHIGGLSLDIKSYVKKAFYAKDYFMAYMIDCIVNENVFTYDINCQKYSFNIRKLSRLLCSVNEEYCKRFSEDYSIDLDAVLSTLKYFDRLNRNKLIYKIEYNLHKLKHDNEILNSIRGGH